MFLIRRITKHPKATFRLSALTLVTGFTVPTLILGWNPFAVMGIDLLIIAATYLAIMFIIVAPIVSAERKFNDECDPTPLIDELRFQITAPKNNVSRFNISLDLASALFENGECDETMSIMKDMTRNQEEWSLDSKLFYYSRLVSFFCIQGDDPVNAENAYKAATEAYGQIPEKKRSDAQKRIFDMLEVNWLFISEQYNECIDAAKNYSPKNLREDIHCRTVTALAATRAGLPHLATPHCEFILENAKKHFYANIAEEILEENKFN